MDFLRNHSLVLIVGAIILLVGFLLSRDHNNNDVDTPDTTAPPIVTVATPRELTAENNVRVIGTVQATTEGEITAQSGGRIARVNVADGDTVSAGTILVELDNQQERNAVAQAEAALRQAQASLPAAGAGAADRAIVIREAEAGLTTVQDAAAATLQTVFSTARRVITGDIDPLFSNPDQGVPGVRVGDGGIVQTLNQQRRTLRETVPAWRELSERTHTDVASYKSALLDSRNNTREVITLLDTLINAVSNQRTDQTFTLENRRQLETSLRSARDQLVASTRDLDSARDGLRSAEETLARAQIADIDTDQEQALASVAQAEATLQSAQIALSETQLRAPVSGTVTDFSATIGAVIGGGTKLGRIIGSDTNEIEVFLSQRERQSIQVGSTVQVGSYDTGTVSRIAPSIDQDTRKVRVIIATDAPNLTVGDSIAIRLQLQVRDADDDIRIPLTAVQFRGGEAFVLIVDEDSKLQSVPVTIGETRGTSVTIDEGITADTPIATDTRGRRAGTTITISE